MADFRKLFLAFAVVALLSSLAIPASAQTAVTCFGNGTNGSGGGGNFPVIRSEGVAELVGDVVVTCTGGDSTLGNQPQNVQIFMNAFVTSRLLSNGLSDALLLINEPVGTGAGTPLKLCPANTNCDPSYNAFQGRLQNLQTSASGVTGYTSVVWNGVPFVAPGSGQLTLRITNVRVDALSAPPAAGQFIPQTIQEFVSVTGTRAVPISNPQLSVAVLQNGLAPATAQTANTLLQCQGANLGLGTDPHTADKFQLGAVLMENFASSLKIQGGTEQSIPGQNAYTENGFTSALLPGIGLADQSTRLWVNLANIQAGITVYVPQWVPLYGPGGGVTGEAFLVSCDSTGTTCQSVDSTDSGSAATAAAAFTGDAATAVLSYYSEGVPLVAVSTAGPIFYEVDDTDTSTIEGVAIPAALSYAAGLPVIPNAPTPSMTVGFAPQNTDPMHLDKNPIPRFGASSVPSVPLPFLSVACQCNLLFTYATSRYNYDTGIAVSNTSMDPFGTTVAQHGTVKFFFYGSTLDSTGASVALTTAQQTGTSADVAAGSTYAFSIYSGDAANGAAITGIPNFQGYVIAQANFQYCHGLAFISGFGRGAYDQGASEAYLGLVLGGNALPARGTGGEVLGN